MLSGLIRVGGKPVRPAELAVMECEGSELVVESVQDSVILLLRGQRLDEPVVGHGPFVMNSRQEIDQALRDVSMGRFGQITGRIHEPAL